MLFRVFLVGAHALASTKLVSLRVSVFIELVFIISYWFCQQKTCARNLRADLVRGAEGWVLFSLASVIFATFVNTTTF